VQAKRGEVGEAGREKRLDELLRLKGGTPTSTKELLLMRGEECLIGKDL
jgi:hypothetical protein